jgi:transcriptional regulator with XRE-family HTH domain
MEGVVMDAKADEASGFGQRLRRLRIAAGLTQAELAERAGMSAKSIAALERGRRQHPHPPTVRALAQALGLSEAERAKLAAASGVRETSPALPLEAGAARLSTGCDSTGKTDVLKPTPILTTKLYLPQPSADVVRRPRLYARLERGIAGPLTVITAPAGFGKTTLLADWIAFRTEGRGLRTEPDAASLSPQSSSLNTRVAWLSLDTTESDPAEFLRYLVAALQTVAPTVDRTSLALLHSAQMPPIETVLPSPGLRAEG